MSFKKCNSVNFEQSKWDLEQGYPLTLTQEILTEVKFIDRKEPLCNKTKQTKEILPFVTTYITYNLATPNLKKILVKHWDIIQQQPKPGLLIGRGKKWNFAGFLGTNEPKNQLILQEFCRNFRVNFAEKQLVKNGWFCAYFQGKFH